MSTLIELTDEAQRIERLIIASAETNAGEIDPDLDAWLNQLQLEISGKVDKYVYVMDRLDQVAQALSERAEKLKRASQAADRAREAMRDRVKIAMRDLNARELTGNDWKFQLVKSSARLEITGDVKQLPPDCVIIKTEYAADKARIKELLKAGREIAGCALVPVDSLRVGVNTDLGVSPKQPKGSE